MRKIKKLWDKSQQIKNDIDKIDIEDIKISENKKLKRVYRLDNPWKSYNSIAANIFGNYYLEQIGSIMSNELKEPQFKNQHEMTTIPNYIEYSEEFELPITEQMLPWVHVVPIVNMMSSDEGLPDKMVLDVPNWEDYWEIYGDDDLLWRGGLIANVTLSGGWYPPYFAPLWHGKRLSWASSLAEVIDKYHVWRAKYYTVVLNSRIVCWDIDYTSPIDWVEYQADKKIRKIIPPPGKETTSHVYGVPPPYPIPLYNTIRIKRNLPEPEFFITKGLYYSNFDKSFAETETIKDNKGKEKAIKYKLLLMGKVQYNAPIDKEKVSSISFPTLDEIYQPEFWEDTEHAYDPVFPWWRRGYEYKLVSSSEGTTIKKLYKPLITTIKMKFLVDVANISDKNDKELYVLRTE
jgi:hypothetical protein